MKVGVLALQGAFDAHANALRSADAEPVLVRRPDQLGDVEALVMPGGESTTMSKLLTSSGLFEPIADRLSAGMPVFGTCAGMILLAADVEGARLDQRSFAAIDIGVERNGYGRQLQSFEADLDVDALRALGPNEDALFRAVFIRAPKVIRVGEGVDVLAEHDGVPVLVRSDTVTVASFHPEITGDARIHEMFVQSIQSQRSL